MAEHQRGCQPPSHQQPRQGILRDEECRLGIACLLQPCLRIGFKSLRRKEQGSDVQFQRREQHLSAFINAITVATFGGIERGTHAKVLRSLPRKKERHWDLGQRGGLLKIVLPDNATQFFHRARQALRRKHQPMVKGRAA